MGPGRRNAAPSDRKLRAGVRRSPRSRSSSSPAGSGQDTAMMSRDGSDGGAEPPRESSTPTNSAEKVKIGVGGGEKEKAREDKGGRSRRKKAATMVSDGNMPVKGKNGAPAEGRIYDEDSDDAAGPTRKIEDGVSWTSAQGKGDKRSPSTAVAMQLNPDADINRHVEDNDEDDESITPGHSLSNYNSGKDQDEESVEVEGSNEKEDTSKHKEGEPFGDNDDNEASTRIASTDPAPTRRSTRKGRGMRSLSPLPNEPYRRRIIRARLPGEEDDNDVESDDDDFPLHEETLAALSEHIQKFNPEDSLDEDNMTNFPATMAAAGCHLSVADKEAFRRRNAKRRAARKLKMQRENGELSSDIEEDDADENEEEEPYDYEEEKMWAGYFDDGFDAKLFNDAVAAATGENAALNSDEEAVVATQESEEKASVSSKAVDVNTKPTSNNEDINSTITDPEVNTATEGSEKDLSSETAKQTAEATQNASNILDFRTLKVLRRNMGIVEEPVDNGEAVPTRRSRRHRNKKKRHRHYHGHHHRYLHQHPHSHQRLDNHFDGADGLPDGRVSLGAESVSDHGEDEDSDDGNGDALSGIDALLHAALDIESTLDDEEVPLSTVIGARKRAKAEEAKDAARRANKKRGAASSADDDSSDSEKVGAGTKRSAKRRKKIEVPDDADDCGECINCLDKPKFGGPNIRRKGCENSTRTIKRRRGKRSKGTGAEKVDSTDKVSKKTEKKEKGKQASKRRDKDVSKDLKEQVLLAAVPASSRLVLEAGEESEKPQRVLRGGRRKRQRREEDLKARNDPPKEMTVRVVINGETVDLFKLEQSLRGVARRNHPEQEQSQKSGSTIEPKNEASDRPTGATVANKKPTKPTRKVKKVKKVSVIKGQTSSAKSDGVKKAAKAAGKKRSVSADVKSKQRLLDDGPIFGEIVSDVADYERTGVTSDAPVSLSLLDWMRRQQWTPSRKKKTGGKKASSSVNQETDGMVPATPPSGKKVRRKPPSLAIMPPTPGREIDVAGLPPWETINPNPGLPNRPSTLEPPRQRHSDLTYASWCTRLIRILSGSARSMARHEFFYSDIDRAWFGHDTYRADLARLGVPPDALLTRSEWSLVRRRINRRPRRFGPGFVASQMRELNFYRQRVRHIQNSPYLGTAVIDFGYEVPSPVRTGATVTAYNKKARILHRGIVLTRDVEHNGYLVQFERKELGYEFCPDTEVASHGVPDILAPAAEVALDGTYLGSFFPHGRSQRGGTLAYGTTYGPLIELHRQDNWQENITTSTSSSRWTFLKDWNVIQAVPPQVEPEVVGRGSSTVANTESSAPILPRLRDNGALIEKVAERETLVKLMGLIEAMQERKGALLEALEKCQGSMQALLTSGSSGVEAAIGNPGGSDVTVFREHYAWLLANIEQNDRSLESALAFLAVMYGGTYSNGDQHSEPISSPRAGNSDERADAQRRKVAELEERVRCAASTTELDPTMPMHSVSGSKLCKQWVDTVTESGVDMCRNLTSTTLLQEQSVDIHEPDGNAGACLIDDFDDQMKDTDEALASHRRGFINNRLTGAASLLNSAELCADTICKQHARSSLGDTGATGVSADDEGYVQGATGAVAEVMTKSLQDMRPLSLDSFLPPETSDSLESTRESGYRALNDAMALLYSELGVLGAEAVGL